MIFNTYSVNTRKKVLSNENRFFFINTKKKYKKL